MHNLILSYVLVYFIADIQNVNFYTIHIEKRVPGTITGIVEIVLLTFEFEKRALLSYSTPDKKGGAAMG